MSFSEPVKLKSGRYRVKETVRKLSGSYTLNRDFASEEAALAWIDKHLTQTAS